MVVDDVLSRLGLGSLPVEMVSRIMGRRVLSCQPEVARCRWWRAQLSNRRTPLPNVVEARRRHEFALAPAPFKNTQLVVRFVGTEPRRSPPQSMVLWWRLGGSNSTTAVRPLLTCGGYPERWPIVYQWPNRSADGIMRDTVYGRKLAERTDRELGSCTGAPDLQIEW